MGMEERPFNVTFECPFCYEELHLHKETIEKLTDNGITCDGCKEFVPVPENIVRAVRDAVAYFMDIPVGYTGFGRSASIPQVEVDATDFGQLADDLSKD